VPDGALNFGRPPQPERTPAVHVPVEFSRFGTGIYKFRFFRATSNNFCKARSPLIRQPLQRILHTPHLTAPHLLRYNYRVVMLTQLTIRDSQSGQRAAVPGPCPTAHGPALTTRRTSRPPASRLFSRFVRPPWRSNRNSKLLELTVTPRKQSSRPASNRDKNVVLKDDPETGKGRRAVLKDDPETRTRRSNGPHQNLITVAHNSNLITVDRFLIGTPKRLEIAATQTKQSSQPISNRDKFTTPQDSKLTRSSKGAASSAPTLRGSIYLHVGAPLGAPSDLITGPPQRALIPAFV
jgi:hypothetical protein